MNVLNSLKTYTQTDRWQSIHPKKATKSTSEEEYERRHHTAQAIYGNFDSTFRSLRIYGIYVSHPCFTDDILVCANTRHELPKTFQEIIILMMMLTSYAPISSKIEHSGATQPRDYNRPWCYKTVLGVPCSEFHAQASFSCRQAHRFQTFWVRYRSQTWARNVQILSMLKSRPFLDKQRWQLM